MTRESPLPYVPIDPRLIESKRFMDFVEIASLYDDPQADAYIYRLLLFTGRARPRGLLADIPRKRLAFECGWRGDSEVFVDALFKSGWLTDKNGTLAIEGWERHGGKLLKARNRWRRYKKNTRATNGSPLDVPEKSKRRPRGVRAESTNCPRDVSVLKGKGVKGNLDTTAVDPTTALRDTNSSFQKQRTTPKPISKPMGEPTPIASPKAECASSSTVGQQVFVTASVFFERVADAGIQSTAGPKDYDRFSKLGGVSEVEAEFALSRAVDEGANRAAYVMGVIEGERKNTKRKSPSEKRAERSDAAIDAWVTQGESNAAN